MGLIGVRGHLVEVEADIANGLPLVVLSGLPDTALHEARDRVRAAIVNSGEAWPNRRITVNLLPAALPKQGRASIWRSRVPCWPAPGSSRSSHCGGWCSSASWGWTAPSARCAGCCRWSLAAARAGVRGVVVPADNAAEAGVVPGSHGARGRDAATGWSPSSAGGVPLPSRRRWRADDPARARPRRRGRARMGPVRAGGGRRRRASPGADRAAGCRQDDAGPATAVDPARRSTTRRRWR